MEKECIFELLCVPLKRLYEEDIELIYTKPDNHNSERAIVFRFGCYFNNEIESKNLQYNVDVEYNRNIDNSKKLPQKDHSEDSFVIPDLILHKRGSNDDNILVIEFKTWWNKDLVKDINKIKEFCSTKNNFKYQYGISIILGETLEKVSFKLFERDNDGEKDYTWRDLQKQFMKTL